MTIAGTVAAERYVVCTTRKRDGTAVPSPVWIARIDDATVGFTTLRASGKVKRMRNDPQVTLQPCSARGVVAPGAPVWSGTAIIDPDVALVRAAVTEKYGWQFRAIEVAERVRGLFNRRPADAPRTIGIRIILDE